MFNFFFVVLNATEVATPARQERFIVRHFITFYRKKANRVMRKPTIRLQIVRVLSLKFGTSEREHVILIWLMAY